MIKTINTTAILLPFSSKKITVLQDLNQIAGSMNIPLWLYGSFAVEIFTHTSINPSGDIDIACSKVRDYEAMVKKLMDQEGYSLIKKSCWKAIRIGNAYNAKLKAPNEVEIDISFIKGEIEIRYEKNIIPGVEYRNIHIFSAKDLLRIYKKFGKRNPEKNDQKIQLLKSILQFSKTLSIDNTKATAEPMAITAATPKAVEGL